MGGADEVLDIFRGEAAELIGELTGLVDGLQDLHGEELRNQVQAALRFAHNLKGAASIVGAEVVETLAHALEDALGSYRAAESPPPESLLIVVEAVLDAAQRSVNGEKVAEVAQELVLELSGQSAAAAPQERPAAAQEPAVTPAPSMGAPQSAEPGVADTRRESAPGAHVPAPVSSIRVETSRLDRLMAFADALLVSHAQQVARAAQLDEFQRRFVKTCEETGLLASDRWHQLGTLLDAIARRDRQSMRAYAHLVGEINAAMKRLRMLPLKDLRPVWRRVVADAARKLGKEVEIVFELGDVELDRYVLDRLRDPLMHFLRNAVDHGIEAPEQRVAAGKDRVGKIAIRSTMSGTMVRLEISDDGRGFDVERIAAAALERGVVSKERLAAMNESDVLALLFVPGFSTAKTVSRVSGRGIGLEVVKRHIEELGGNVAIAARPEAGGAVFRLTLPVTLLSAKALLVRAGGATFVVPTDAVQATQRIDRAQLRDLGGLVAIDRSGEPLRVRRLAETSGAENAAADSKVSLVILARGSQRLGLLVDEVLREQEVVTKRLPWNLKRVPGVSGTVILSDGAVAVAVDVAHQLATVESAPLPQPSPERAASRPARLLVVEDSPTVRAQLVRVLTEAEYAVTTAADGEEAWQHLQKESFELVLSDVQMPRLDGLGLTRRIRATARTQDLPVMLVTNLASADDIAHGAAAGANEYLVKGAYSRDALLRAVQRLTGRSS